MHFHVRGLGHAHTEMGFYLRTGASLAERRAYATNDICLNAVTEHGYDGSPVPLPKSHLLRPKNVVLGTLFVVDLKVGNRYIALY